MDRVDTLGDETILVQPFGVDNALVAVSDPQFGRIATVRLDATQIAHR